MGVSTVETVDVVPVHERLRRAREARGERRSTLARRIGVAEKLLQAIDEGRLGDLPSGLYARTAIRQYARGLSIDPEEALAGCASLLPSGEDAVIALARLRGVRPAPAPAAPAAETVQPVPSRAGAESPPPFPAWRPLAAVAADGAGVAGLLLLTITATMILSGSGPASFGGAAGPIFALLGLVLAGCYFVFFGGIACATAGERLVGMRVGRRGPRHIDPRMVAIRGLRCWGRDVRYLLRLGLWAGAMLRSDGPEDAARSIRQPASS